MKLFKNILMALAVIATLFTAVSVIIPPHYTPKTCEWCGEELALIKDTNDPTTLVSIKDLKEDLVSIEDAHANLVPIQNKY